MAVRLFLGALALSLQGLGAAPSPAEITQTPADFSYSRLISFIQSHSAEEGFPYMLELATRIESEAAPEQALKDVLEQTYAALARYYFNRFSRTKALPDSDRAVLFGKKLRERFPNSLSATETLNFEIQCHFVNKDWKKLTESLETGLKGIKSGRYPASLRERWLETSCLVYAIQEQWAEGEPRFRELYEMPLASPHARALAAIYLIQCYEAARTPEKTVALIPALADAKDDRYDPRLNLSLFKLGNQFSELGEYSFANYLYFLCLTIEEIVAFNEGQLHGLEARREWFDNRQLPAPADLADAIKDKAAYIAELKEQTSYTGPLKYYRALNLDRMKRRYDSFFAYLRLVREHPEHPSIELFHYTAFYQATGIGYFGEATELGESYLKKTDFQTYRREVLVKLMASYFELERYDKVREHGTVFMRDYPEHPYALNAVHFMCHVWLRLGEIDTMRTVIGGYLAKYPDAPMAQSAHYWIGLGDIIEQDFQSAADHFDHVINNFPDGSFYPESLFRRAVCEFGLGDYEAAETRFNDWIASYPENHLRGEAEVFLGDIAASRAAVEQALGHYAQVEKFTPKMNLIDHAYFEGARLLEANQRMEDLVDLLSGYTEKYPDEGNLSMATYEIGKAYERLGRPEKMLESYFAAIQRFGNNRLAEGVDDILLKYAERYENLRRHHRATIAFIEQLLHDDAFRLGLIDDRLALHAYRMKHPDVDRDLLDLLLRDVELRNALGTRELPLNEEEIAAGSAPRLDTEILPSAREFLNRRLDDLRDQLARFPNDPPEERYRKLLHAAREQSQRTLELRLLAVFNKLGIETDEDPEIRAQDIAAASPDTLVWIGSRLMEQNPELARLAVETVLSDHPFAPAVPAAIELQAEMEAQAGRMAEALSIYDSIQETHPVWPGAARAAVRAADLCRETGQTAEALRRYLEILNVRDWRGEIWAETCFKIGQCFEATKEPLKAHGYYERTYLSYRQFPFWAGKAFFADGVLLETMGEADSARSVYTQYLSLPGAETLPDYNEVRGRKNEL